MSDENMIVFRPETEFPLAKRLKGRCKCSHIGLTYPAGSPGFPGVWVDEFTRDLECKRCGARLDAFDYVMWLATEGKNVLEYLHRLEETIVLRKAESKLLDEEIRDLKAKRNALKRGKTVADEPRVECRPEFQKGGAA